MGFIRDAAEHGLDINLKHYIGIWGAIFMAGLVLDHYFGWDLLLKLFVIANGPR